MCVLACMTVYDLLEQSVQQMQVALRQSPDITGRPDPVSQDRCGPPVLRCKCAIDIEPASTTGCQNLATYVGFTAASRSYLALQYLLPFPALRLWSPSGRSQRSCLKRYLCAYHPQPATT